MNAGLSVNDACIQAYNQMKMNNKMRYIICSIQNNEVVLDSQADKSATHQDLVNQLTGDAPKYVVTDFEFTTDDGRKISKLVFIYWCPDTAPLKSKLVYATTKETFKSALQGIFKAIEAQDFSQLEHAEIVKELPH